jgi:hypothetical protein
MSDSMKITGDVDVDISKGIAKLEAWAQAGIKAAERVSTAVEKSAAAFNKINFSQVNKAISDLNANFQSMTKNISAAATGMKNVFGSAGTEIKELTAMRNEIKQLTEDFKKLAEAKKEVTKAGGAGSKGKSSKSALENELDSLKGKAEGTFTYISNLIHGMDWGMAVFHVREFGLKLAATGIMATSAISNMRDGFKDLRQAGVEAFDYIGSNATQLADQAIHASSMFENFRRTVMVHLHGDEGRAKDITQRVTEYEVTSPFIMSDVLKATRKIVAKGIQDPAEVERMVRLAGEMSAVNDQDIGKAADVLRKIMARSPEAYRSLKQNFAIGPDELKRMGIELDSGDRLRMRTGGDAKAVINAIQKYYNENTGMKAAETQSKTITGMWSSLESEVFRTTANYADIVSPDIKKLIQQTKDLVHSMNDLAPSTKANIAYFVSYSAAAYKLSEALSPIYSIVSNIAGAIVHLTMAVPMMVGALYLASQSLGAFVAPFGGAKGATKAAGSYLTGLGERMAVSATAQGVEAGMAQAGTAAALSKLGESVTGAAGKVGFFAGVMDKVITGLWVIPATIFRLVFSLETLIAIILSWGGMKWIESKQAVEEARGIRVAEEGQRDLRRVKSAPERMQAYM